VLLYNPVLLATGGVEGEDSDYTTPEDEAPESDQKLMPQVNHFYQLIYCNYLIICPKDLR